jgi:D-alanyl-D-alanine carboxypeptidase
VSASLPTAGDCGTLVHRFVGQAAGGRIRAKTGSLIGVASLTGFVAAQAAGKPPCPPGGGAPDAVAGGTVTFSLLVNGVTSDAAGIAIEDRVANALVTAGGAP